MTEECSVEIINKRGLHARAAARFASLAANFNCDISVQRDAMQANGKSIMGLMMLAAPMGTTILIRTDGDDASAAAKALSTLVGERFGEGE